MPSAGIALLDRRPFADLLLSSIRKYRAKPKAYSYGTGGSGTGTPGARPGYTPTGERATMTDASGANRTVTPASSNCR